MTVKIEHALKFVTEVDENHPIGKKILSLSEEMQIAMLEGMLKELLAPAIQPAIDLLNENGSYAILKVVK
jgi:hypothetical protein